MQPSSVLTMTDPTLAILLTANPYAWVHTNPFRDEAVKQSLDRALKNPDWLNYHDIRQLLSLLHMARRHEQDTNGENTPEHEWLISRILQADEVMKVAKDNYYANHVLTYRRA